MLLRIIATFVATLTFSLILSAPKKELVFCGLCGAVSCFFWELSVNKFATDLLPTFIAGFAATSASRFFAIRRYNPASIYMIAGIIPLVPGASLYYTMFNILTGNGKLAAEYGVNTVKISGVICLAIVTVLALPYEMFALNDDTPVQT